MEFQKVIRGRRSVRQYESEPVAHEVIEHILDAALYAPNAGNRQQTRVVVCENREINERIGKIHSVLIGNYNRTGQATATEAEIETARCAFYDAPTVLYLLKPKNFYFSESDAYILADSICLAAYDEGVSSCIVGEVGDAMGTDDGRRVMADWGIPEGYKAFCYVLFGHHRGEYPSPHPRKYAPPLWVD